MPSNLMLASPPGFDHLKIILLPVNFLDLVRSAILSIHFLLNYILLVASSTSSNLMAVAPAWTAKLGPQVVQITLMAES